MIRPAELIPYVRHEVTPEDEAAVLSVLRSKWLTQGPKVEEFEAALAKQAGATHCICVSSGTDALDALYHAIGMVSSQHYGCLPIISLPAITFVATATMALDHSQRVIVMDVDAERGFVRGSLPFLEPACVMLVSLGGDWPYNQNPPKELHTMPVTLADLAHGPLRLPRTVTAGVFSFHPAKHLACGEGGAVVTNDDGLAGLVRAFRDHGRGRSPDGDVSLAGRNARMPEMAAALGLSQLSRLSANVGRRQAIADHYDKGFAGSAVRPVPHEPDSWRHLYQVHVQRRTEVQERLRAANVGTQVHYRPITAHSYWRVRSQFQGVPELPGAHQYASTVLSIPMFPSLTDAEVEYVAATVRRVVEECQ